MEAFVDVLRWVVAVALGLFGLWSTALNILILFSSLAGHRMPSYITLIGSVAVILALVAVPYPLAPWVWALVGFLVYLSESAGSVRNRAVVLIDAQTAGLRGTLIRGFLKDILLLIAVVLLMSGLGALTAMLVHHFRSTGG